MQTVDFVGKMIMFATGSPIVVYYFAGKLCHPRMSETPYPNDMTAFFVPLWVLLRQVGIAQGSHAFAELPGLLVIAV